MSGASKQRARQERIDSLGIQKPRLIQWWQDSDKADFALRIAIAVVAAGTLLVVCQTWKPAFSFRRGSIPPRDMVNRVSFEVPDNVETNRQRNQRSREQVVSYSNRTQPLDELRAALRDDLFLVVNAPSFDQLTEREATAFAQFFEGDETQPEDTPALRFSMIKTVFADDMGLTRLDDAIELSLRNNYRYGLIQALAHDTDQGSLERIRVYPFGQPDDGEFVEASEVRMAEAMPEIAKRLREQFRTKFPESDNQIVASMISDWIAERLPEQETLTYDDERSEQDRRKAAASVETVMMTYRIGTTLADAGKPLTDEQLVLLQREWEVLSGQMYVADRTARVAAYAGMIGALYLLCGSYIFFVDDRQLLLDRWKLAQLLTVMVVTISLAYFASRDQWRGELIPMVLASIVLAVVYGRELGLLLMAAASVSLTLFLGLGIRELVMLAAACFSCTLLLARIRSRTHLLYVGALSAMITGVTVIAVGIVTGATLFLPPPSGDEIQTIYRGPVFETVFVGLVREAFWAGFCILVSATAMTGLLPLVEKTFGVQTDLSLLELGDASHPLLRRLAQRAPGTYNHSINVASIAEAAADEIGANGLLVRVGAYFHDIGKMFKPEYFIENQNAGVNQHDSLQPAMSTLVIIAHVKDGADLARSHHLPEPIVDFILQHHGTTLVEYFYREAARRSEEDPNAETVSDKDFRYPGPKPQTIEAAVMMLADAVESASRTLVDPTPSRIQNLVDAIAQKKVADGQFDECGLTFRQLDRIRRSLVKSLTAIYHARVKYPGQQLA
ncbi:MAG: HDIG domain-containing protein [Planctomycetaceae bacterium]|jgi:putative nucleotidyltransferase with HDIG domain|nr:HDIG domain-containing protein [Planctomycetaceae bacterium]